MSWYVYIIECRDKTLYTGMTNNLQRRVKAHNSGNGGRYTSYRCPVKLVYFEAQPNKSAAQKREAQIKRLARAEKLFLCSP